MKRNPRKVKWTKAYRRVHGKDMAQDSTFEFERKRNRPERYDRNLAENVLKVIPKIDKIRVSREERHHKNRMKGKKEKLQREAARSWSKASVWSKLLLCFNMSHLLLYQRSKSRFPSSNQRRITQWKSDSVNATLYFFRFSIYGYAFKHSYIILSFILRTVYRIHRTTYHVPGSS